MGSYLRSGSGRALVLFAAIVLIGVGLTSVLAPSPAAAVLGFITPIAASITGLTSVGLAIERYPVQALALTLLGPVIVWPGFMAAMLRRLAGPAVGHVLVAAGVMTLAMFVILSLQALARRRTDAPARASG